MHRRALLAFALAACATAQTAPPITPAEAAPQPAPQEPSGTPRRGPLPGGCDGGGGIQVEGQLGTIPVENVRRVVRDGNDALAACFRARLEALPCLAGRVELKLRVGTDGAVRWAVPVASTMGDREVERCMIDRARELRFSAPCGGEAEVSTSIELDGGPDARAAVSWPAARVAAMLRQRRAQLLACRGSLRGDVHLTAYVARDGSVAAAGSDAASPDALTASECALREVRAWRLPSPGSWYARVTFNLPLRAMNLDLNDAQRTMRDRARDYATATLAPHAETFERDERIPREVLAEMAALGLMGVNLPTGLGGAGAGVVAYACAMREVARGCASTAVTMAVTNMVGEVIERFGTEAQRARHVPRLARGEYAAGAFALSEPEAGSDPGAMRTTATREDGQWVIRGAKQWITSGPIAGVFVVWARTGGPGTSGISCFLVEGGTPGLKVGRHEDKMGLRGSATVPLEFDDVRVPEDALLGVEGGGFRIAMMALDGGRVGIASQAVGIATAALDVGFDALARGALRGDGARRTLAEAAAEVRSAWLLALRAAWRKEQGLPFSQEASVAKLYASECAWRTCNRVSDAVGAAAVTDAVTLQRHLRDSRVTMIYEGTSEIQRLVIARSLLKG